MKAGAFRHRVTIEDRVSVQDGTGDQVPNWVPWASNVPAAIYPASAKEFTTQGVALSQVTGKIVIRWREGVKATMRIRHGDDIYNILGVLSDDKSGRSHITMPVSRGTNVGG